MTLLRADLLRGRSLAIAGEVPRPVHELLIGIGATCESLDSSLDEERAQEWARARSPLHALLYDAAAAFGNGGPAGLQVALEQAWGSVRAVGTGALIPAGNGGKIVLLAPRPNVGPHAQAARAALENLARTLSVEWARYSITTTTITPGADTQESELAELIGFLVSRAGDYFSGCRLSLGAA